MNELLSKQGKSITHLSRILLDVRPGDRLPAMQEIAAQQDVSVGTVQAAMQYLQSAQVVTVQSRGRLGAFVQRLNYVRLWELHYRRPMTGILPMPYSRHLEGLATGLRDTFDAQSLAVALRFMRGSSARLQRLHAHQCDWVVASLYAAEAAAVQGFDVRVLVSLGTNTYTTDHVLLLNGSEQLASGMRVGIDTHSADHAYVVRLASRGTPVQFVEMDYSAGLAPLLRGEIEATVWTRHDLPVLPDQIHIVSIDDLFAGDRHIQRLGEAVLVGLPESAHVENVLSQTLDVARLTAVQADVLAGRRRPTY